MPSHRKIMLAAFILLIANLCYGFPGTGNHDSDEQYAQALNGHYTDWHPPVMAWFWSKLHFLADGNAPLLVFHLLCYWLGFGLVAAALSRKGHTRAAWAMLVVGVLPPFITLNICVCKDVGLAVTFLAAFAISFWYRSQDHKIPAAATVLAALLLSYGILVRANGIFAGAPILIYLFYPALFARPIRFIAALGLIVAITIPASGFFNHKILGAMEEHPIRSLQLFDVTGIAYFSHDASVFWPGPFTNELVEKCYTPILWDRLAHGQCHVFWDLPSPGQGKAWISAIIHHPLAYAEHRLAHFNSALDFIVPRHHLDNRLKQQQVFGTTENIAPLTASENIIDHLRFNPLFSPVFSLVLGLVLLALSLLKSNSNPAILCLAVSALAYMSGYLFIGVASDYRYQYWAMMAIFMAAVMYVSQQREYLLPLSKAHKMAVAVLSLAFVVILIVQLTAPDALVTGLGKF